MKKKLSEIAQVRAGHAFRGKLNEVPKANTYAIQMKNTDRWHGIDWSAVVETPPAAARTDWLQRQDILLVARGINNVAFCLDHIPFERVLAAPHFYHITLGPGEEAVIHPEFLAWQINQKSCQDYLRRNAEGSTSKSVRRAVVDAMPIVIPPMPQQMNLVAMAKAINKERMIAEKLIRNSENLMNKLAAEQLANPE